MIESNWKRGESIKQTIGQIIHRHDLKRVLQVNGYACLLALACRNAAGELDDAYRTLIMQEMIARGVLFQGLFYTTWSHQESELNRIATAFDESCATYAAAIKAGTCAGLLIGRPAKPVFRKKV